MFFSTNSLDPLDLTLISKREQKFRITEWINDSIKSADAEETSACDFSHLWCFHLGCPFVSCCIKQYCCTVVIGSVSSVTVQTAGQASCRALRPLKSIGASYHFQMHNQIVLTVATMWVALLRWSRVSCFESSTNHSIINCYIWN